MRRWMVACAALLWLPAMACAQQVVGEKYLTLQLDVTAQGRVRAVEIMPPAGHGPHARCGSVSCKQDMPAAMAKIVTELAANWRFMPAQRGGKPVAGRTFAQATMKIFKSADGGYRAGLVYLRNGPAITYMPPPSYPAKMIRLGYGAGVVAEAKVDPDGSVSDVRIVKVFTEAKDRGRSFSKAVIACIKRWKGLPVQLQGQTVASRIRIPMIFETDQRGSGPATYKKQVDAEMRAGLPQGQAIVPIKSSDVVALDTPFARQPSS